MEIEALKSLLAFVDTGSITRAAQQVNRTQSAISMQMKKLESDLDKVLFEKRGRNLVLTRDGHHLVGYAKQLVTDYDIAVKRMKQKDKQMCLKLACPDDYADTVLPKIVAKMHQLWQHLDLIIHCLPSNVIREKLDCGELDLGIVTRAVESEEGYVIAKDKGVWVANGKQSLLTQNPIPIAIFQQDCRFHHAAVEGLHKLQQPFKIIAKSGSVAAMRGLVNEGLAIAAMASSSKGLLHEISSDKLPILPEVSIVLLSNAQTNRFISHSELLALSSVMKV